MAQDSDVDAANVQEMRKWEKSGIGSLGQFSASLKKAGEAGIQPYSPFTLQTSTGLARPSRPVVDEVKIRSADQHRLS